LAGGRRLRRDRLLGGGALGRTLRCDALSGPLGLCGTDHQRHTLFLEALVEAAQYVLPLSSRNLVSFEGPTHVTECDLPPSLPPLTASHPRVRLGDLRRERRACAGLHAQPLGTLENGFRLSLPWAGADRRLGDGLTSPAGAGEKHTAMNGVRIPSA